MKWKRYRIVKEINGCYRGEFRFIFIPFWWYIDESITMSLEECERYVTNYINNGHAGFVKYMPILLLLSLASCDSWEIKSYAPPLRDTVYVDTFRYWFIGCTLYYEDGKNSDAQTVLVTGKQIWHCDDITDTIKHWAHRKDPTLPKIKKVIITNLYEMKNYDDYNSFFRKRDSTNH